MIEIIHYLMVELRQEFPKGRAWFQTSLEPNEWPREATHLDVPTSRPASPPDPILLLTMRTSHGLSLFKGKFVILFHTMQQENGLSVEAKMAAIAAQSPELTSDVVRKTAEREVSDGKEIWGAVDFTVNWYPVEGSSREQMQEWKGEVDQLLSELEAGVASGDLSSFIEASKGTVTADDIWGIIEDIKRQAKEEGLELDAEAKQLLAIDLWIKRQQGGKWKKETLRRTAWKILTGEGSKIADVLDRDAAPNCIDVAYLAKAMSHQFGVNGEVRQLASGTPGIDHRYFQAQSGKVLDYWWLPKSGGVALSETTYQKLLTKRARGGSHSHQSEQEK
ncbi:MAG: hypothetical protein AAB429_02870 [Patescibacteria group bacterium]